MAGPQGVISGIVRGPGGKPVADARVYFTDGPVPLPEIAALTDRNGAFALTGPAPGKYVIECSTDRFATKSVTVKVASGQQVRKEILLRE